MNDIILSTQNGEPVVSSREVAKNFGKEHKDVLKAINNLVAQNCAAKSMFHLSDFENGHTSINKTPKVTGKGQIYFVNQFVKR